MNAVAHECVVFRVDSSLTIGTGHVMRCLALAARVSQSGRTCHFICRDHPGHQGSAIEGEGHRLTMLPLENCQEGDSSDPEGPYDAWLGCTWREDADRTVAAMDAIPIWMVVDHYALDSRWESAVRLHCRRMMVIDDLAARAHDCDIVLDQTPGRTASDYAQLAHGRCLAGPSYALLRRGFLESRQISNLRRSDAGVREILINMGGIDLGNATTRVLDALRTLDFPEAPRFTVVMGGKAPWLGVVQALANQFPFPCRVMVDVRDMANLAAESDLAIGAAGVAALERCCLGLPSVLVILAENQRKGGLALRAANAAEVIESADDIATKLVPMVKSLFDSARRASMSEAEQQLVDGRGVDRVFAEMQRVSSQDARLRRMRAGDLEQVRSWRNDDRVNQYMFSATSVSVDEHQKWFERVSVELGRHLLLLEVGAEPRGFVNIGPGDGDGSAYWGLYVAPGSPKGTGRMLGEAALDYSFNQVGLRRLRGEVLVSNRASIGFHLSLGFKPEGEPMEKSLDDSRKVHVIKFSLTAEQFRNREDE